jgi:hypothetical protein|tara:strand:- start:1098 stop:1811 length:714 start_codon:yes stop_codon:yes gene_type:complete
MALPKLNVPKYKLKLPSDGRTVNFRPFLVREEKLLLMATESGESSELITAVSQIISDCTDIQDVSELATFDIEYLFLQIRTKSVGETIKLQVTCPDDNETVVEAVIPLDEIKVTKTRGHKKDLKISDDITITMGYPKLETFITMNFTGDEQVGMDQIFDMASSCLETISDTEQVYDCADTPKKEILDFFDQMDTKQFTMIQTFFETMPKLSHKIKVTNPNTNVESEVVLEGLASFFA